MAKIRANVAKSLILFLGHRCPDIIGRNSSPLIMVSGSIYVGCLNEVCTPLRSVDQHPYPYAEPKRFAPTTIRRWLSMLPPRREAPIHLRFLVKVDVPELQREAWAKKACPQISPFRHVVVMCRGYPFALCNVRNRQVRRKILPKSSRLRKLSTPATRKEQESNLTMEVLKDFREYSPKSEHLLCSLPGGLLFV